MSRQNPNFSLDNNHLKKDLGKRSAKAGAFTLSAQLFTISFNLLRGAILARLLVPEDYGLQGMLMGVIGIVLIFKDLGLGTATVREKELSLTQVNSLFWANALIGLISMIIVVGCGPLLSLFYNEPRLTGMALVLSIGYLFGGISVQHHALLRRQMLFGRLVIVNVTANILSSIIGVILGYMGYGYWALIWMLTSMNFFLACGFAISSGWIPELPSNNTNIQNLLKTGIDVAALNIFATISKHIDKVILGKFVGPHDLGLYNRAFTFNNQISGNIRMSLFNVSLPALSSLQSEPERFRSYYLKFIYILALMTMPLATFFFSFSEEIVSIYLGSVWIDSAIYLRILSIGVFITPVVAGLDQIPLSLGHSVRYRNSGIFKNSLSVFLIVLGIIKFGALGAAVAVASSSYLCLPVFLPWTTLNSPIKPAQYIKTLAGPMAISLIPAIFVELYRFFLPQGYLSSFSLIVFVLIISFLFCMSDLFQIGTDLTLIKKALNKIQAKIISHRSC